MATRLWSLRGRTIRITSGVLLVLFGASMLWLVLALASPFMVPSNTLLDLSGTVGMRENDAQFDSLSLVPRTVYVIGDIECHQLAERSYFLNGNQIPFCARDLGLFAGLAAGFGIATLMVVKLNPLLFMLGLVPLGLDGGIQFVTDYESTNPLRLATGLVAGASLALLLAMFVLELRSERPDPGLKDDVTGPAPSAPSLEDKAEGESPPE